MNKLAQLRQELAQASTWDEQLRAVSALERFEAETRQRQANDRALDLAAAVADSTLAPVTAYDRHTAATDWMGSMSVTASQEEIAQRMVAEASAWYRNRPDYVKADQAEFGEQARGMAAKLAGQYAPLHQEAAKTFLDYVAYLRSTEAGSGLDQIQQTIDANNAPKTTELPTDVFDNFAPPVHQLNDQVEGTETSERNPMFGDVEQKGGGQGGAEKPDEHDTAADFSHSYAEVPPDTMGRQGSVALGYRYSMDDYRRSGLDFRQAATGLDEISQEVGPNNEPNDENPAPGQSENYPTGVAFPLVSTPEEQITSPNGVVPKGAAAKRQEFVAGLLTRDPKTLSDVEQREIRAYLRTQAVRKTADEWSAPHNVPGGETPVGNSAQTTPQRADSGSYQQGVADGQRDRAAGERPTFSDASSRVSDYVQGYSEGYGAASEPQANPDVPYSMGGDAGQPQNAQDSQNAAQVAMAARKTADGVSEKKRDEAESKGHTLPGTDKFPIDNAQDLENAKHDIGRTNEPKDKVRRYINERAKELGEPGLGESDKKESSLVSVAFVDPDEANDPDFRKGYRFAAKWAPGKKLVATGSAAFEAGLYAAISDRPQVQRAWVEAHRERQDRHPELGNRLASHAAFTQRFSEVNDALVRGLYVQAATSTDLDTTGPGSSPDPMGSTPINGPGTVPPLAGQGDPAAAGGPSPYQGAAPYGNGPVAPDPVVGPYQGQEGNGQFVPMPSPGQPAEVPSGLTDVESVLKTNPKAAAFRQLVTAARTQS